MPQVLDCIRYMKESSFLPIGITDCQGPLSTAYQLMGYDNFIFLMFDHPSAAYELMDKITESLIVWIADDDAVLIGSDLYQEFVVPYNSRISRHSITAFCTIAEQLIIR